MTNKPLVNNTGRKQKTSYWELMTNLRWCHMYASTCSRGLLIGSQVFEDFC